jgi:hypothetical protein
MAEVSRRVMRDLPETASPPEARVEIYVEGGCVDTILTNFPARVTIYDYDNHREEMEDRDRWGNPCEACALEIGPAWELLPQIVPNSSLPIAAPELLAALRGWLAIFERPGAYVSPLVADALRDTRAAIAKACPK